MNIVQSTIVEAGVVFICVMAAFINLKLGRILEEFREDKNRIHTRYEKALTEWENALQRRQETK